MDSVNMMSQAAGVLLVVAGLAGLIIIGLNLVWKRDGDDS